jgi:hypothetical protein
LLVHWPTLSELDRYLAPMNRFPPIVWAGVVMVLLLVAMAHAKARIRREQEKSSEEHGWQFSNDWSPIEDNDWQQLSQNSGLASLSSEQARRNYTYGTHNGVVFVLFDAPGRMVRPDVRGYESMVAFHKPSQTSRMPSLTLGAESSEWEKFLTDNWIFLRFKTPHQTVPTGQTARFINEAYGQLQLI